MILVSPASDYKTCAKYADYLKRRPRKPKSWSASHAGARWEMALGHKLGIAHVVKEHLDRAGTVVLQDFEYDFEFAGLKFDAKAIDRPTSGLMLKSSRVRKDVIYVLGLCTSAFPCEDDPPRDMKFTFLGWLRGDSDRLCDSSRAVEGTVSCAPCMLHTPGELVDYIREHRNQ